VNWKLILMRILIYGLAIAITAFLLPGIQIADNSIMTYLILGAVFGLLGAFVKPAIQFLTLPLLFVTYGLVIVMFDTVTLILLELLLPDLLAIRGTLWAIAGGAMLGFLGNLLENLLGLTPPIIDDASFTTREG
jgi:putative membrane protein